VTAAATSIVEGEFFLIPFDDFLYAFSAFMVLCLVGTIESQHFCRPAFSFDLFDLRTKRRDFLNAAKD
jgi:hypothetical protein